MHSEESSYNCLMARAYNCRLQIVFGRSRVARMNAHWPLPPYPLSVPKSKRIEYTITIWTCWYANMILEWGLGRHFPCTLYHLSHMTFGSSSMACIPCKDFRCSLLRGNTCKAKFDKILRFLLAWDTLFRCSHVSRHGKNGICPYSVPILRLVGEWWVSVMMRDEKAS